MDTKIYIVVAVISTTFIVLAAFMFYLDKRLRKLEKKNTEKPIN
jgi:hypothetical protein